MFGEAYKYGGKGLTMIPELTPDVYSKFLRTFTATGGARVGYRCKFNVSMPHQLRRAIVATAYSKQVPSYSQTMCVYW